jgi:hypothetical protein
LDTDRQHHRLGMLFDRADGVLDSRPLTGAEQPVRLIAPQLTVQPKAAV